MPDSPPSGDEEHTSIMAVPNLGREDRRIKEQNQTQTRILNTNLNGQRATIGLRYLCQLAAKITRSQRCAIVEQNDEEDIEDIVKEDLEILRERYDHHTEEQQNRDHLRRLGNLLCGVGEVV